MNPSTFNIFRDSLKATSDELHRKLLESLPNIDSGSEEDGVSSSDGEIVPLDFRTATINQGNDLIIQVKPLHYKKPAAEVEEEEKDLEKVRDEEYLEMLRLQQFEEDDEMV